MLMTNVCVSDILMAMFGTVRGLGIISPRYMGVGEDNRPNWWCKTYALVGSGFVWRSVMPVLVPLTVDRVVAIIFPLKYRKLMTRRTCKAMVLLTWALVSIPLIHDCVLYGMGTLQIEFQSSFHRCVYKNMSTRWRNIALTVVPFFAIILMYISMGISIYKSGIETKKLSIMSTAIIGTGLVAYTPSVLISAFKVQMSFEATTILVITCFYMNSIYNPIIYFFTHPYSKKDLAMMGRRIRQSLSMTAADEQTLASGTWSRTADKSQLT